MLLVTAQLVDSAVRLAWEVRVAVKKFISAAKAVDIAVGKPLWGPRSVVG